MPKTFSIFLICTLLWLQAPGRLLAQDGPADYTFGDCSAVDKDQLRDEIQQVAHDVLTDQSAGINIDAIVMRQWVGLRMDDAIDAEVQRAIDEVYANEGYWSRLWSGWSSEKAQEFATRIASSAFGSESFHQQIDALSIAIAQEISQEIEANFARAASAAFLCMKAYVGDKYSGTLFNAFESKVSTEVEQVDIQANTTVDVSALDVHQKALGGVGLIVVTEISRRIAVNLGEQIAERIAGKIVARIIGKAGSSLIPVAGWVIGLGLIVWDLWEGGKGALPQIQDALQSEEVKAKIRQEVTDSIKDGLPEEVSIVSLEIAVNLVDDWNSFCDNNRVVCTLAHDNATFQDILDYTPLDQVGKLVALVNVFVDNLGRAELDHTLDNGQFEKLQTLPDSAFTILAKTKSVDTTLAWAELAGDRLDKVAEVELYTQKEPADYNQDLLRAVLNLDDSDTISKVVPLDQDQLGQVVTFAGSNFVRLAHRLSADELAQLATYLANAETAPSPELATDLASGRQTVTALLAAATANKIEAIPTTTATPTVAAVPPPMSLVWQYIYANSIVVASGVVLFVAILLGAISGLGKKRAPKPKAKRKARRKPRDVYDIFHDE
ncbi:MAG: hypothetical protein R3C14_42560 [Caldilineaceae bacterium]